MFAVPPFIPSRSVHPFRSTSLNRVPFRSTSSAQQLFAAPTSRLRKEIEKQRDRERERAQHGGMLAAGVRSEHMPACAHPILPEG